MDYAIESVVAYRIEQARAMIADARLLLAGGRHNSCVNRAYYSIFYAVQALLATRSISTSRHSAALELFDREFVRSGLIAREYSKWLHRAFENRMEADYADFAEIDAPTAEEHVLHAE